MTCLGKIIGGGLPVGAFGGKKDIMEHLAPSGPVYQAGTLSGNPVALSAGWATLTALNQQRDGYEKIGQKTATLCKGMEQLFAGKGISAQINRIGSMFTVFFAGDEVFDFTSAAKSDTKLFARYFKGMLSRGINLAPSQFEAAFLSFAHTDEDMEKTLAACADTLKNL